MATLSDKSLQAGKLDQLWRNASTAEDPSTAYESLMSLTALFLRDTGIVFELRSSSDRYISLDLDLTNGPRIGPHTSALLSYVRLRGAGPAQLNSTWRSLRKETFDDNSRLSFTICIPFHRQEYFRSRIRLSRLPVAVLSKADIIDVLSNASPTDALVARIRLKIGLARLSPYVPRGPVREGMFYGRVPELSAITNQNCSSAAFIGGRQIGKTSLFLAARSELRLRPEPCCMIDCANVKDDKDFLGFLVRDLLPRGYHRFQRLGTGWRIADLLKQVHDRHGPPTILLDEIDALLGPHQGAHPLLFPALRTATAEKWCRVFFAGFKELNRSFESPKNALPSFCEPHRLTGLDIPDAARLLREPLNELGVSWQDKSALEHCVKWFGGHPCHLQRFALCLLRALDEANSSVVTEAIAESACRDHGLVDYACRMFRINTTDLEKLLVFALCSFSEFTISNVVSAGRTAVSDFDDEAAAKECNDLAVSAILKESGTKYTFASPFLRSVIRESYDLRHEVSYLARRLRR